MELDFSKLENIAYRGLDGDKAKAEKDALIEQGFTVVDDKDNPFRQNAPTAPRTAPEPPIASALIKPSTAQQKASLGKITDASGKRSYKALYRAAHDFHERHYPPSNDMEYWEKVADDMCATASRFNQDPFLIALLVAIFEELEREEKKADGV